MHFRLTQGGCIWSVKGPAIAQLIALDMPSAFGQRFLQIQTEDPKEHTSERQEQNTIQWSHDENGLVLVD